MRSEVKYALLVGVILLAGGVAWFSRMRGQSESGRDYNKAQQASDEHVAGAKQKPPTSGVKTPGSPLTTTNPTTTRDPSQRTRPRLDPARDTARQPNTSSPLLPGAPNAARNSADSGESTQPRNSTPTFEPRTVPPRDERPSATPPRSADEELTPRGADGKPIEPKDSTIAPARPADEEPRSIGARPSLPLDPEPRRDAAPPNTSPPTSMTPTPSNPTVEPRTPSSRGVPNPSFRLNGDRGAPTTTTPGGEREYVVKEGDTFVGIAEAEYGDQKYWTTIESANPGVDPRTLKVGQKLKLPAKPAPTTTPAATPTTPRESASSRVTPAQPTPADSGRYHVIAEGDTLAEIAEQYYGEQTYWPQLLKANPDVDPARLLVGNKLRLPDKEQFTRKETRPTPADQPRSGASRVEPSSSDAPEYIVESGDSLIGIARKVLGDGERWNEIFELNKDRLDSADDIRVGMKLRVPRPARTGSTSRR